MFKGVPGGFQKQPVLRIENGRFHGPEAKKRRIEFFNVLKIRSRFHVIGIAKKIFIHAGIDQFLRRIMAHGRHPVFYVLPEFVRVCGIGKRAGHADNGDIVPDRRSFGTSRMFRLCRAVRTESIRRRCIGGRFALHQSFPVNDKARQRRDGRILKQDDDRDVDIKNILKVGVHPEEHQGIPAEIEKIIGHPDVFQAEGFRPDFHNAVFRRRSGRDIRRVQVRPVFFRRRQGQAVDFAGRCQGKLLQDNEVCRNHIVG